MDTNARHTGYEARARVCASRMNPVKRLAGEFFFFGMAGLVYLAFLIKATFLDTLLGL